MGWLHIFNYSFCILFVERLEQRLSSTRVCPKKEGALASNEFVSKFKIRAYHESQLDELQEQMEAVDLAGESQGKSNGQV